MKFHLSFLLLFIYSFFWQFERLSAQTAEIRYFQSLFTSPSIDEIFFTDSARVLVSNLDQLNQYYDYFMWTKGDLTNFSLDSTSLNTSFLNDSIFKINSNLKNKELYSYSYFKPSLISNDSICFIVIPGSGDNQSLGISQMDSSNYNEILSTLRFYGDSYVVVKPNEDFRAIKFSSHSKKISQEFLYGFLMEKGGSYSYTYLAEIRLLFEVLKKSYKKIGILGCSQGGTAALVSSMLNHPDLIIVASGYSILFDLAYYADLNQLLGMDMYSLLNKDTIYNFLLESRIPTLFTWGSNDNFFYKTEANNRITSRFFSNLTNVKSMSWNGGHQFCKLCVEFFLEENNFIQKTNFGSYKKPGKTID